MAFGLDGPEDKDLDEWFRLERWGVKAGELFVGRTVLRPLK
jgi:hypothetical protein